MYKSADVEKENNCKLNIIQNINTEVKRETELLGIQDVEIFSDRETKVNANTRESVCPMLRCLHSMRLVRDSLKAYSSKLQRKEKKSTKISD